MLMDSRFEFSTAQAITATADSENHIDLGAAGDADEELYLICRVGTALASGDTDGTLVIGIETDDNASFSSGTTLAASAAIAEASLTANKEVFTIRMPRGLERYVQLTYTVGGTGDFTSGTVDAFVTKKPQTADFQA